MASEDEGPAKGYDPTDPNPKEEEDATAPGQVTRRSAIKSMVVAGTVGVATATTAASMIMLIQPELRVKGTLDIGFIYKTSAADTKGLWYEELGGLKPKPGDFPGSWEAAATFWRFLRDEEGDPVDGTGIAALLFKVNASEISTEWEELFDYLADNQYMAVMAKCLHACCVPNWKNSRPDLNTIYCVCHDSEYDPRRIVPYQHPTGAKYWAVHKSFGPAPRGMPIIPLELDGNEFIGQIRDIGWYVYCGVTPQTS